MNNEKYLSVSALTQYLKYKFDNDDNLKMVFLKGEISNFKSHTSGHLYFSIKDEKSKINAIMFSASAKKMTFIPAEGTKVLVIGRIGIYESTGNYQIYIDEMLEDGVGNLYIAFEKLKEQLLKEGLFDEEHKKPIPTMPKKIGVITASTGAAIKDIISTIKRRYPIGEVILFPSLVQGEQAASDIVKKINLAQNYDLDVLIVGRGGGSIEDLWPFNEEVVARAIYNSNVPVISAVGHEVDYTIADFVADLRAPTPTAAAELAVPNIVDIFRHIDQLKIRVNEGINRRLNYSKLFLDTIKNSFILKNPVILYENKKQQLDLYKEKINKEIIQKVNYSKLFLDTIKNSFVLKNPVIIYENKKQKLRVYFEKINTSFAYKIEKRRLEINNLITNLELLNPISLLSKGYSLIYKEDKLVSRIKDIKVTDNLSIKTYDGTIGVVVKEIKENLNE